MQHSFSLYSHASLSGLFHRLTDDLKTFARQEAQLAKREVTEKVSRYGRHTAMLAIGGLIAYAGLIVLVVGVGWLLAFCAKTLGIAPQLANFIGLGTIGLFVLITGVVIIFKAIKAFSSEPFAPERTVETIKHLKGAKQMKAGSLAKNNKTKLSLKDLEGEVLETEDRIEQELKEIAYRASPPRIIDNALEHLLSHSSQWSLVALGGGLIGGYFVNRKLRLRKT